jgi:hypothetical protein
MGNDGRQARDQWDQGRTDVEAGTKQGGRMRGANTETGWGGGKPGIVDGLRTVAGAIQGTGGGDPERVD